MDSEFQPSITQTTFMWQNQRNFDKDQCRLIAFDLVFLCTERYIPAGISMSIYAVMMQITGGKSNIEVAMSFMLLSFESIRKRCRPTAVCEADLISYLCIPTCIR